MKTLSIIIFYTTMVMLGACLQKSKYAVTTSPAEGDFQVSKTDKEWKEVLSPLAFHVMREQGTEKAFTGKYWNLRKEGVYTCAGCENPLFSSKTKFDSGTGWPSYWAPLTKKAVNVKKDYSYGMVREEVHCSACGGHLGHVFRDGPEPTRLRYCVNSVALNFKKK